MYMYVCMYVLIYLLIYLFACLFMHFHSYLYLHVVIAHTLNQRHINGRSAKQGVTLLLAMWSVVCTVLLSGSNECCTIVMIVIHTGTAFVTRLVCWLVGCLTSQQQTNVSQGRICSDNFTGCHTEIEVADPAFYLK